MCRCQLANRYIDTQKPSSTTASAVRKNNDSRLVSFIAYRPSTVLAEYSPGRARFGSLWGQRLPACAAAPSRELQAYWRFHRIDLPRPARTVECGRAPGPDAAKRIAAIVAPWPSDSRIGRLVRRDL